MSTSFVTSPDGTRIAYDVSGTGTPIILLHGGFRNRHSWHNSGHVERLKADFQVITIDIRGNGESDKPTNVSSYTTDKHCQDILAVADACGHDRFALWGFSYGGNIGRYLAAQSTRISRFTMVGIPFGSAAPGDFRKYILDLREHWTPVLRAQADGTLDLSSLTPEDQSTFASGDVPVTVAWLSAMLEWAPIEPHQVLCPTLWLVGSRNDPAMSSIQAYKAALAGSQVQVQVLDGLNHREEFSEVDKVLPKVLAFTQS